MIRMKISTSNLDKAYDSIRRLQDDRKFFNVAIIKYNKGARTDYNKPESWPLKFLRMRGNKKECELSVAVATAGYRGMGPLFTYNALLMMGFLPGEEIFHSEGDKIYLEYKKS